MLSSTVREQSARFLTQLKTGYFLCALPTDCGEPMSRDRSQIAVREFEKYMRSATAVMIHRIP